MNIYDLENITESPISFDFNGQTVTVKKHISESQKIAIANKVKTFYFTEDGVSSPDFDISCKDLKNSVYVYSILANYTDVELGEDNDYVGIANIATVSGLLDKVLSCIPLIERAMFKEAIDDAIENEYRKIAEENNIENQIGKLIEWVKNKIPSKEEIEKLMQELPDTINKIDPSKLTFIQDAMKTLNK